MRSYSTQSEATTALAGSTLDAIYSDSTVASYTVETTGGQVETVSEIENAQLQRIEDEECKVINSGYGIENYTREKLTRL